MGEQRITRKTATKKVQLTFVVVLVCVITASPGFFVSRQTNIVKADFNANGTGQRDDATSSFVRAALAQQGGGGLLYTVDSTGNGGNVGSPNFCDDGTGYCTLRAAIQAANLHTGADGIEIGLPAGSVIIVPQALPDLSESVIIYGPGANLVTVQGGAGNNFSIFKVSTTGIVTFSGLTIRGGTVTGDGGGFYNGTGTLNINNCIIRNNGEVQAPVGRGGGIHNIGTLNVTNSTISGNIAGEGGGISNSAGAVNITNSTISGNSTSSGGAIRNTGIVNITNSTITGNSARGNAVSGGEGGGIINLGTVNITNCTIAGNSAIDGPGGPSGGGIYTSAGTVTVKSSIIALNSATTSGGGGTSGPDVFGNFVSAGFNLIGKRDGGTGFTSQATDQTGTIASPLDPKLNPQGLQDNGGLTKTIALLGASPAIDKGTSVGLTGNLTTDQRGAGFPRTFDIPAINNPAGGNGTDVGAFEGCKSQFDFDGDGKADVSVFRPSSNVWHILRSQLSYVAVAFGQSGDLLSPADFDGDGKTDIAVFRPSNGIWYRLNSSTGAFYYEQFGANGDVPVPADFDRDGKADLAIFRPSTNAWYWKSSTFGLMTGVQFGATGDKPAVGDFDGDGKADISLYRPSNGGWYRINSSNGSFSGTQFGISEDKPTPADYDGDGKTDISVYRPSTGAWYRLNSSNGSFAAIAFGISEDKPVAADYDGDGKAEIAVFRPSGGVWYMLSSINGAFSAQQFGISEDRPTPHAFVY